MNRDSNAVELSGWCHFREGSTKCKHKHNTDKPAYCPHIKNRNTSYGTLHDSDSDNYTTNPAVPAIGNPITCLNCCDGCPSCRSCCDGCPANTPQNCLSEFGDKFRAQVSMCNYMPIDMYHSAPRSR